LEFDIGFLPEVIFSFVGTISLCQNSAGMHARDRFSGDRKRGIRVCGGLLRPLGSQADYGIWYARSEVVKARCLVKTPKIGAA
jgi:hypothetical protein